MLQVHNYFKIKSLKNKKKTKTSVQGGKKLQGTSKHYVRGDFCCCSANKSGDLDEETPFLSAVAAASGQLPRSLPCHLTCSARLLCHVSWPDHRFLTVSKLRAPGKPQSWDGCIVQRLPPSDFAVLCFGFTKSWSGGGNERNVFFAPLFSLPGG